MEKNEKKQYIRLVYQKTFRCLGLMLVISLGLGTLLGGGVFMMNALCAMGFVMLCWGWFTYLKITGMRPFGRGKGQEKKVPFFHRREKEKRPHRPSFRMQAEDFDDDLVAATMAADENFSEKQVDQANAIARALCGFLLVAASFLIPLS